jgi:hypothetical protein
MRILLAGVSILAAGLVLAGCDRDGAQPGAAKDGGEAAGTEGGTPAAVPAPRRKPGQWEHKVTIRGETRTMKICIDAAMDKRLAWWGSPINETNCDEQTVVRQPDGTWTFRSACRTVAGGSTVTEGGAKGDFNSKFFVVSQMVTTGSSDMRVNGTLDTTVEATWLGPCPGGQRAGDVQMPGGQVRNIVDMMEANRPGAAR